MLEKATCILHKLRVNSTDSATAKLNFISHIELDMCGVAFFHARSVCVLSFPISCFHNFLMCLGSSHNRFVCAYSSYSIIPNGEIKGIFCALM